MVREVHGLVSAVAAVRNRIRKQIIHHTARQCPLQKPRNIPAFVSVALSVFHRSQNAERAKTDSRKAVQEPNTRVPALRFERLTLPYCAERMARRIPG